MDDVLSNFFDSMDAIETVNLLSSSNVFRRPRIYRERVDLFTKYDDKDFVQRFRLTKASVLYLLDKIEHNLEYFDNRYV